MIPIRRVLLVLLAVGASPSVAVTQSIATDRPDFVDASSTVGSGQVQIEGAFAFDATQIADTEATNVTTPLLVRVGIATDWEFRVESDWFVRSTLEEGADAAEVTTNGVADFAVGLKWAFLPEASGAAPSMAALVHATLPTGTDELRGLGARPSFRVTAQWTLADWGIGVMPGLVYDRGERGRFVAGMVGAVLSRGITNSLRGFVEVAFDQITEDKYGGDMGFVDFGATLLLSPRWQVDAAAAVGITDQSPDFGFTVGLSGLMAR